LSSPFKVTGFFEMPQSGTGNDYDLNFGISDLTISETVCADLSGRAV
jgi:hypothetical protein